MCRAGWRGCPSICNPSPASGQGTQVARVPSVALSPTLSFLCATPRPSGLSLSSFPEVYSGNPTHLGQQRTGGEG